MTLRHPTYEPLFTLAAALLLISCSPSAETQPENETTEQTSELPKLPLTPAPMDREELLISVVKAASAAALGQNDAEAQRELNGDRFEFRIRFGCPGSMSRDPQGAPFNVLFDPDKRTLRIRASPDIDLDGLAATQGGQETIEAVEGFWIREPWILNPGCAAATAESDTDKGSDDTAVEEKPESAQTRLSEPKQLVSTTPSILAHSVGIAQYFTDTDPRTIRRNGRAYELTTVLKGDERPSTLGYNLVLSGRLRSLPQGNVITCIPRERIAPPECMISVTFDRVWVENPSDKGVLAEWS